MTEELPTPSGRTDAEAPRSSGAVPWPVDAAIGAASITARVAAGVATSVVSSAPAQLLGGAARWVTSPLSREGSQVRARIGAEAGPTAQQVVGRFAPGVIEAIDLNGILAVIDIGALLDRIDIGAIVARVDVNGLIADLDLDTLLESIDIDALIGRIDLDGLVGSLDLNQLVGRLDLNELVGRIDLNALLASIDLDALLAQLDMNGIVEQIDVDALVANTEMGGIIARSTSGVASEALDAVRSQGVGLDNFIGRLANRMMRRDADSLPAGPRLLVDDQLALPPAGAGADGAADGGGATP